MVFFFCTVTVSCKQFSVISNPIDKVLLLWIVSFATNKSTKVIPELSTKVIPEL